MHITAFRPGAIPHSTAFDCAKKAGLTSAALLGDAYTEPLAKGFDLLAFFTLYIYAASRRENGG